MKVDGKFCNNLVYIYNFCNDSFFYLKKVMKQIQKKIVIVGSWWAWLRCAIQLREKWEKDILIIWDRAFVDAHTTQARWGINAALHTMDEEDTPMVHAVDTYREWQELAHPDLVELLANNAPDAIADLIKRGAKFHHEDDGRLTQRFFGAHSYRRTVFSWDQTGKEMIRVMSKRAKKLEIPYLEHTYVYEILKSSQWVQWIKAIDKETDEEIEILADHVVFATWGYSNVYQRSSSRNKENFGDGIGIAFRAWSHIGDIELIQFHPTGLIYPKKKSGELVTEAMRWEWAILLNSEWERFMNTYDPQKLELSTRDVVARANYQEILEWRGSPRGGVFLDISHKSKEYIKERLPKMYAMIKKYNKIDISQEPVEVAPTTHYTMWWICFDAKTMQTNIKGFWVAWECAMGVHGANRLWGNSLMETMVFGKEIADAILASKPRQRLSWELMSLSHGVLVNDKGINAKKTLKVIRKKVRELAGIVRNEENLIQLQQWLTSIREEFLKKWIRHVGSKYEDIMIYTRLRSVVHLALLICNGALARKESRGAHFRTDYPTTSKRYNKNLIHYLQDTKIISSWQEIKSPSKKLLKWLEDFERTENYGHSE